MRGLNLSQYFFTLGMAIPSQTSAIIDVLNIRCL